MNTGSTADPAAISDRAHAVDQELGIPAFYCPIPSRTHPQARDLNDAAVSWLHRHRLATEPEQLKRLSQCDFGGLTAYTMPDGEASQLHAVATLHAVLFALDDGFDEAPPTPGQLAQQTSHFLRVLEAPRATRADSVYASALRDVRNELGNHMSDSQMRRWVEGMRTYMSALATEAEYRRNAPSLPTLDDYMTMWMRAIGMAPSTALLDVVTGHEVADHELDRPRVRALTEMTWILVALDNDLYSRHKEVSRAGDHLNVIDVLAREHGCDLRDAQERAVRIRDRIMVRYLALGDELIPEADRALRGYLTGLRQFVRGHLDWARSCRRYALASGEAGSAADWWKPEPADRSLEAPDIPSIAGWWE